jgi:starch synthase (maltosyl-transferring)
MAKPVDGRKRVVIEGVTPQIDGGRFPIKRVEGETVTVEADIFGDGHDEVSCRLLYRREGESGWHWLPMESLGNDRWRAEFPVEKMGRYFYTLAGREDHFLTWCHDLKKRIAAGQDISVDLQNGALLLEHAVNLANEEDAVQLTEWAAVLREQSGDPETADLALDPVILETVQRYPDEALETRYEPELVVIVDREKAQFAAWYELFPRSTSSVAGKHGTFRDCEAWLPYVAELGFDVLYFPPIHPIGKSFRKGKNNAVSAEPGDVGSPWAIGSEEGGHTAILAELGTLEDFKHLLGKAGEYGIEIALDIAFQCAPDHPWVREHPDWFRKRADGTIQYAENPPKKYQDIYPLDFESADWSGMWNALRDVFLYWIDQGVKIFRVDNPHTKAFAFWEWAIGEIRQKHPDAIFLAEAFTRPKVMHRLGKLGFTQSYTYFAWRNTKEELTQYFLELTRDTGKEYFRPNVWPNTPDILTEAMQVGGRQAFMSRFALAATLGTVYGIYGPAFELLERVPRSEKSEEYLNSEKYELKHWDLDSPASLRAYIARMNKIRRENEAFRSHHGLQFHPTDNPYLICYSKSSPDGSNLILAAVNLDPFNTQSGWVSLDLVGMGIEGGSPFEVHDLLSDARFQWQGVRNFIQLPFEGAPAHVFKVSQSI